MSLPASEFLKSIKNLSNDELVSIKGMGQVLAENLINFAGSQRIDDLILKFELLENNDKGPTITSNNSKSSVAGPLSGQKICITGTFEISRTLIKEKLEVLGASVIDSVNSATTMLVCGSDPGSKLTKAEAKGIKIIYELVDIPGFGELL